MKKIIKGNRIYLCLEYESHGYMCSTGWYYSIKNNQHIRIGEIELHPDNIVEFKYLGNIGISIIEEYQNHGYAKEAIELLTENANEELAMTEFRFTTSVTNQKCINLIRSLGGTFVEYSNIPKSNKLYVSAEKIMAFDLKIKKERGR